MKIKILLFALLIQMHSVFAQQALDTFLKCPLLENANISLIVRDAKTNTTICQFRSKNAVIPASNMKLVTTATALELLGPEFKFKTILAVDGKISKDSILNGNLYIYGGGDPTLGSEKLGDMGFLTTWVKTVKKAGINKITGSVIADAGIFDDEGVNQHWTWDDLGNYYAAGVYGIAYMDNTCKVILHSGKTGTTPEIVRTVPVINNLIFENNLKSARINYDSAYFFGAPKSNTRIIRGEIPFNKSEFTIKCDIPNPALLLATQFHTKLLQSGVNVLQPPTDKVPAKHPSYQIYIHESPVLSQIITETNVHSNNLYAEQLFRYLGLDWNNSANSTHSVKTIRNFWKSKGLAVDQLFQQDGSGLSPVDAVSAEFLSDILSYMLKSPNKDVFFNSLPVSGTNGTLSNFLKNTPLQGKVHAKSGTISRVKSYSGYIVTDTKDLVFSVMVNNANGTSKEVVKKMEEFLVNITINETVNSKQ